MAKDSIDSLCALGKQALAKGKYEQARQCYLRALALRADQPDVHYGLATVSFVLNDLITAAYHFKEVTRLDPLRAGAFINLGAVYNRLEQLDEAVQVLRRGIQLDSGRAEGYYNLALVYRKRGQDSQAVQAYREATRVNPRMADAHYNLANIYLDKGQYAMAIAHYRMALETRPHWDKAQQGLELAENALSNEDEETTLESRDDAEPEVPAAPQEQGPLLKKLHQAAVQGETQGRSFLQILESEVEPALKEMSACLLDPAIPASQMDACVRRFETALARMRQAKREVHNTVAEVSQIKTEIKSA